eukprot:Skav211738  [mRNA]  locus=scaffold1548:85253:87039:+ [translate_table: standard]
MPHALPHSSGEYRVRLGCAERWGEAKNPGPKMPNQHHCLVRLGIINPSSIQNKADLLLDYMRRHSLHMTCLSETHATLDIQRRLTSFFRKKRHQALWSNPVSCQDNSQTHAECDRAKAGGVALVSQIPTRKQLLSVKAQALAGHRILYAITWIGQLQFQVVVCYGFPQNFTAAKTYTNELLQLIQQQIAQVALPFIVVGDFNADIKALPAWTHWRNLGCKDLQEMHGQLYQKSMAPTCQHRTNPDNGIVCPVMQQFLTKVEVMPVDTFATHNPVIITLQSHTSQPLTPVLRLPKTFMDHDVTLEELESALPHVSFDGDLTLEQWGGKIEDLVHSALKERTMVDEGLHAVRRLTRAYRGRCRPRDTVQVPYPHAAKPARQGDYTPTEEVTFYGAKGRIRQYRRIQSFYQQLKAHQADDEDKWFRTLPHLRTEGNTILKSRAFGMPFHVWLSRHPDIGYAPWPLPSLVWLHDVKQLVLYELEAHLAADKLLMQKLRKLDQMDEKKRGSANNFAFVKGATPKTLQELSLPVDTECDVEWLESSNQAIIHVEPDSFHWGTPILLNDQRAWVGDSE